MRNLWFVLRRLRLVGRSLAVVERVERLGLCEGFVAHAAGVFVGQVLQVEDGCDCDGGDDGLADVAIGREVPGHGGAGGEDFGHGADGG